MLTFKLTGGKNESGSLGFEIDVKVFRISLKFFLIFRQKF